MTCEEYRHLLILAELEEPVPSVMRDHFEGCAACQSFVQDQTALQAQLRELSQSERAPESLRRQVLKMIEGRAPKRGQILRHRMRFAAIAAGMLLALTGYWGTRYYLLERGPTADHLAQQFVSDHLHYLPGREQFVSDSPQAIQKWFEGRVDFPVHVPEILTAAVEDARVCNIAGRKAALLHYRHKPGETLISLFVTEEPKSFEKERHPVTVAKSVQGYNASLWCKRGLVYALVASIDEASLKQIADSVKSQVP